MHKCSDARGVFLVLDVAAVTIRSHRKGHLFDIAVAKENFYKHYYKNYKKVF